MEKVNKQQKDMITENNQIFRQRLSTLCAENTQLKSALEAAQKESAAISEERNALKVAARAAAESTSALKTPNGCENKKSLGTISAGRKVEIAHASVCSRYI
jgi:hypothetical protein